MSTREEGFLSRWSRRKRGELPELVEAAPLEPPPLGPPPVERAPVERAPVEPGPLVPAPDADPLPEAFDPATLPPVESLTEASDFTGFLRPGVPAPLRQAALRRAWTLDPAIRDFIGPADYAWDYNAPDGVPGFALQLGGDVTRLLAQAIGALEDLAKPEGAPADVAAPDPPVALVPAVETPLPEVAMAEQAPPPAVLISPRRHGRAMPV